MAKLLIVMMIHHILITMSLFFGRIYFPFISEQHRDRPTCPSTLFQAWETFLQEIEADSVTANDIAKTLSRQVKIMKIDF